MKTKTLPVVVRCVCLLLVIGMNCNTSVFGRRILYGQVANPANYPFVVHLKMHSVKENDECSGTVISNHFILTAAHCLYGAECDKIQIGKSSWQRGEVGTYMGHQCHIHFDYKSDGYDDDIALLETRADLLQDPEITRCDLPIPDTTYAVGTPALIVGWGHTENSVFSATLLHTEVHVSDWNDCNEQFKYTPTCPDDPTCPLEQISQNTFCTLGDGPSPPGICIGDSGGPVIIDETLAGVISATIVVDDDICEIGTPSLHTLVSEYVPWIMTIADLERHGKYSRDGMNAPVAQPLRNYTSRAGLYQ